MPRNDNLSIENVPDAGPYAISAAFSYPAFIIDTSGTILEFNSAFSSLFAIPSLNIAGLNAYGLQASGKHVAAVASGLKEIVEDAIESGKSLSFEEVLQGRTFIHTIEPLRSSEGDIAKLLITVRDVEKHKGNDEADADTFRFPLEAIPGVAFLTDESLKLIAWNHQARDAFFGRHEATMTGIDAFSSIHSDDLDHIRETFLSVLAVGAEEFIEARAHHHRSSSHVWWKIHGKRVVIDGNQCLMIIGTDITALKQRESELRAHKKWFSQSLSESRIGVWEWNLKTNEQFWSDEMWNLYGLERGTQKPSFELAASVLHPRDREMVIQASTDSAQNKREINLEYRVFSNDGSTRWLMVHGRPVHDSQGHGVSFIGTVIDITDRKQLFEQLLCSEAKFRSIFDTIPNGITYCKMIYEHEIPVDFIYLIVNPAFESLTGHREVTGKRFTEVLPNIHLALEEFFQLVARVASTGLPEKMEYYLGTFHEWLSITVVSPEKDHFVATFEVITELKTAELSAREDNARLVAALSSMTDAMFFCDADGRLIDCNEAFATFYRFRSKKECLKSIDEYPEILDAYLENGELARFDQWVIPRALRGEKASQAIYKLRRKDTGENWTGSYGFAPIRSNDGHIIGAVVTARDITEQKNTENALRENEIKFRSIFDYAPLAIGIGDLSEGQMIEFNNSWLKLFGYTRNEIQGRTVDDLRLYSDNDERDRIIGILNAHGRVVNRPVQLRKKTGEIMDILYSAETLTLGDRPCLLVMLMDVTPPNQDEKDLESDMQNASNLEPLVADISHRQREETERMRDLMTITANECLAPLDIIRRNIGLMELKKKLGDFMNEIEINKITRSIEHMAILLEYAIQESCDSVPQTAEPFTVFSMASLIADSIETFRSMWPERSLIYSEHFDDGEISGKLSRLKLAIFSLLDNARMYSPQDSLIEMDAYTEHGEAVVGMRYQKGYFTKDKEELFPGEQEEHIYDDKATDGMRLWLVTDIIKQHYGSVTHERFGFGGKVTVRLPLNERSG
jgi:PAS domain S-box-containing protein